MSAAHWIGRGGFVLETSQTDCCFRSTVPMKNESRVEWQGPTEDTLTQWQCGRGEVTSHHGYPMRLQCVHLLQLRGNDRDLCYGTPAIVSLPLFCWPSIWEISACRDFTGIQTKLGVQGMFRFIHLYFEQDIQGMQQWHKRGFKLVEIDSL